MTDKTRAEPIMQFRDLEVAFKSNQGRVAAVRGVNFDVLPGEVVALVGESGSGKSVTCMSALGLLPQTATVSGSVRLDGHELTGMSATELTSIRGSEVGFIFQEPMTALNPIYTIGYQLREAIQAHSHVAKREAARKASELLDLVGLDEPGRRLKQYPYQLSGGQRQRVVIAMAISGDPKVIIADEPTTALDVTVQANILDLIRRIRKRLGTSVVLVTHNMGVVADIADKVVVMLNGEVVEDGDVEKVLTRPGAKYTQELLAAVPRIGSKSAEESHVEKQPQVLDMKGVIVEYRRGGRLEKLRAVDHVSLDIAVNEVVGLVGESGSGKSTLGRCAIGMAPMTAGTVEIMGRNLNGLNKRELRHFRRRMGFVFQDPSSSLNPRLSVRDCISAPLRIHHIDTHSGTERRVNGLLKSVELPASYGDRYPHELSGGQRQRVGLARALALEPKLLVADEPTSALDVSVQASILRVLLQLQEELRFACLFISHDLAVVDALATRVVVMRNGAVVEQGRNTDVLRSPQEPYTKELLGSAPVPDPSAQRARREKVKTC